MLSSDLKSYKLLDRQPRVRGWLLASVDGQTTGLVPANYVKILGRRKGTRQAQLERLSELQQGQQIVQPAPGQVTIPGPTLPEHTALLESIYGETPAHPNPASVRNNTETNSDLETV